MKYIGKKDNKQYSFNSKLNKCFMIVLIFVYFILIILLLEIDYNHKPNETKYYKN